MSTLVVADKKQNKYFLDTLAEYVEASGIGIYSFLNLSIGLFKSLTEFHQTVILRLLGTKGVHLDDILVQDPAKKEEIEKILINKFRLIVKFTGSGGPVLYKLEDNFLNSLRIYFSSGLKLIFPYNISKSDNTATFIAKFEEKSKKHGFEKWNSMHRAMLTGNTKDLPMNVKKALEDANLVMSNERNNSTCFDFLLDSLKNQVNWFLYAYNARLVKTRQNYLRVDTKESEAVNPNRILNFLYHLALLSPQLSYKLKDSSSAILENQLTPELVFTILKDLNFVGLMRLKEPDTAQDQNAKPLMFAPTPLLYNIFNTNVSLEHGFKNQIIVESDFTVYAYSNNLEYLEALLNLFTRVKFKMPTLIVCIIDDESISRAFKSGIKPKQILSYLNSNIHREVRKNKTHHMSEEEIKSADIKYSFLPENVVKQFEIWHDECIINPDFGKIGDR